MIEYSYPTSSAWLGHPPRRWPALVYPLISFSRSVASADMSGGRFVASYWAGYGPHEQTA